MDELFARSILYTSLVGLVSKGLRIGEKHADFAYTPFRWLRFINEIRFSKKLPAAKSAASPICSARLNTDNLNRGTSQAFDLLTEQP